jgi:hypothetical protein
MPAEISLPAIATVRGHRVILDADLATLYGVPTKRLNEAVKRNSSRFPPDFMLVLTRVEAESLRSQFATPKVPGRGGRRTLPRAFSEHGALMAATVLNSPRAVEVSLHLVRAFVRLRATEITYSELAGRIAALERSTQALGVGHVRLSRETEGQLKEIFRVLREMANEPDPPSRPIGFVPARERAPKARA